MSTIIALLIISMVFRITLMYLFLWNRGRPFRKFLRLGTVLMLIINLLILGMTAVMIVKYIHNHSAGKGSHDSIADRILTVAPTNVWPYHAPNGYAEAYLEMSRDLSAKSMTSDMQAVQIEYAVYYTVPESKLIHEGTYYVDPFETKVRAMLQPSVDDVVGSYKYQDLENHLPEIERKLAEDLTMKTEGAVDIRTVTIYSLKLVVNAKQ